jgi:putative phosphoesterase
MRFGLLSDVHANLPALEAVLNVVKHRGVDQLLVAGDLIGYGAQPNECVARLAELGALCVSGNHDLFVLGRLPPTRFPALARQSAELTQSILAPHVQAFLSSLPLKLETSGILMTHGSLDDPEEYVVHKTRAMELLSRLPQEAPEANTLILGHTHQQWCVVAGRGIVSTRARVQLRGAPRLLNPGSVGQSRQRERRPRARFAVYDTELGTVDFSRVDYDVEASLRRLQDLGLPARCLHAPPRPVDQVAHQVRRILGR